MGPPGLFFVTSKITLPDKVSPSLFTKWYESIHIPDMLKTSGIQSVYRYQNLDPKAPRPYLACYPVSDIDFLQSDEFKSVPVTSDILPAPHSCLDVADFDARYYELIQTYEPAGRKAGPASMMLAAALSPAIGEDADFDAWYREEHCEEVSKCPGHRRSRRYKLAHDHKGRKDAKGREIPEPPRYLALHEFDEKIPNEAMDRSVETSWSRSVMGACVKAEMGVWRLVGAFGDEEKMF